MYSVRGMRVVLAQLYGHLHSGRFSKQLHKDDVICSVRGMRILFKQLYGHRYLGELVTSSPKLT